MELFSKEIQEELSGLFEEVANEVGSQVGQRCIDKLNAQYSELWNPFETRVTSLFQELDKSIKINSKLHQEIIEEKDLLKGQLQELSLIAKKSIHQSLDSFEQELLGNLQQAVYNKMYETIEKQIEKIAKECSLLLEETTNKLEKFGSHTKETLAEVEETNQKTIKACSSNIESFIQNSTTEHKSYLEKSSQMIIDNNKQVTTDLSEQTKKSLKELSHQLFEFKNKSNETISTIKKDFDLFKKQGEETLENFFHHEQETKKSLEEHKQFIFENLQKINENQEQIQKQVQLCFHFAIGISVGLLIIILLLLLLF